MKKPLAAELQKIIDSATPDSKQRITQEIEKLRAAGIDSFEAADSAVRDHFLPRNTRSLAVWFLGQLAQKRAVASLLIAFADPALSWEAAKALGVINSKRAVKPLVIWLLESPDTEQRAAAAYALGLLADERTLSPLVKVLGDSKVDPKVRGHAAEALANLADDRAVSQLVTALKDRSAEVRFWATFALGQLRNRKALPKLKLLTKDRATLPGYGKISDAARKAIASIEATK